MPVVSVVTCTYNRAHLIGETIRSVLDQTFQDFEYIIIDDGSTDNTASVVEQFKDKRIKYVPYHRTGGHLSRLRNVAHSHCAGEFIAYIDSDDLWNKDKLARQVSALQKDPGIGFSYTDIQTFDSNGVVRKTLYGKSGELTGSVFPDMLANKIVICHTTLVIRKSCLATTGPMDEAMHSGDHDLVFFLSGYFKAFVIYEPLVRVRKHDQNSTSGPALYLKLLKEHHRTLGKLLEKKLISSAEYNVSYSTTSYSFGCQLIGVGLYRAAISYLWISWKSRPYHIKSFMRILQALTLQIFSR